VVGHGADWPHPRKILLAVGGGGQNAQHNVTTIGNMAATLSAAASIAGPSVPAARHHGASTSRSSRLVVRAGLFDKLTEKIGGTGARDTIDLSKR
jgi:predicted glycosyltransferase